MTLAWATLVEGSETPAGDGVSGALRCVIETDSGEHLAAVLKRDPPHMVYAEALCGLLLARWGLRVPRPYLVQEANRVSFASADVGYPNLKKRLGWEHSGQTAEETSELVRLAVEMVMSFDSTPLAVAIDEAIDNRDRNFGNILWDGEEVAWIDHALALGNGQALADANKLCQMAIVADKAEQTSQAALARWMAMDRDSPVDAAGEMPNGHDCSAWQAMISERLDSLGMRILARFPQPNDLLGGP